MDKAYGPLLALAAYGLYSLGDASIRGVGTRLPAFEMAFIGALVSLLMSPLVLRNSGGLTDLVRPRKGWRWALRGVFAIGGTLSGIFAWSRLPLAETAAILFLSPLLTSFIAPLFLREKQTLANGLATIAGLIGVLIVLRPGLRELSLAHAAALCCALCGAGTGVLLRATKDDESAGAMYGASVLSVLVVCGLGALNHFVLPTKATAWLMFAYTVCGGLANILLMYAWRFGPALVVAPIQYSQIFWGIVFGLLFFAEAPDAYTVVGGLTIVISGIAPVLLVDSLWRKASNHLR